MYEALFILNWLFHLQPFGFELMISIEVGIVINTCIIDFYTIRLNGILGEKFEAIYQMRLVTILGSAYLIRVSQFPSYS